MSSKLRLNDLSFDYDGMEEEFYELETESLLKSKASKPKRNKQEFVDYSHERSQKRRYAETLNG